MKLESIATALNIRTELRGAIFAELRQGDLFEVETEKAQREWVYGTALTGYSTGQSGYVRRKWLVQHFDAPAPLAAADRQQATKIIAARTAEFDAIRYDLGTKAKSWAELNKKGGVDCSGWVYLLCKEILAAYQRTTQPGLFYTHSDEQITACGSKTGAIYSAPYLTAEHFQPGTLVGIDFAEYSWDRGRPLDIDHIVIVGADQDGLFISQSSGSGAGVNRVPLARWLASNDRLIRSGRAHLVDVLALP